MSAKPDSSVIPPEIELADRYLLGFHRVNRVTALDLADAFNRKYPAGRSFYLDYHTAALEVLMEYGYVMKYPGEVLNGGEPLYGLTQAGRDLKDVGSFSATYLENKENKVFTKRVGKADGQKKIWDNRSKYFVFLFAGIGAVVVILGFWASHGAGSGTDRSPVQVVPSAGDSSHSLTRNEPKKDPASLTARKHHPKPDVSEKPAVSGNASDGASTAQNPDPNTGQKTQSVADVPTAPKPIEPLQSTTTDNIEFKLLKAQGNARTQSITMTLVLTTSAANHTIDADVRSIIDNDGNEYNRKSFTIGTNTITGEVDLTTGVPLRCTYTFGGILPDVKRIKLFTYTYYHTGGTFHVEFRDIPIDWR